MSRIGNPYDNAQVESFITTLKHEEVYSHDYATVQDAIDRLLPPGVRGPACPKRSARLTASSASPGYAFSTDR